MTITLDSVLVAALLCAVFTDVRARRISNRLTYPLMAFGLAANAITGGWHGLSTSALGWLAGIALMLIPFALGAMGAGDVKLMAAIGALKGPHFVLVTLIYASLAGGLLAIAFLVRERRVTSTVRFLMYGWVGALKDSGKQAGAIPYAPAIAAGAILALLPLTQLSL